MKIEEAADDVDDLIRDKYHPRLDDTMTISIAILDEGQVKHLQSWMSHLNAPHAECPYA